MNESAIFFQILTVLIPVAFGVFCYFIAKSKGRNESLWAVLGVIFCFIAFVILICMPKKSKTSIKEPVKEKAVGLKAVYNESAAALNTDDTFEPRKPRISASKALSWHYINQKQGNSILGPFSINELRKQIQTYKLDLNTYIWCEELEDWTKISEFSNSSFLLDTDFIE
jgi:hypothetical protein